MANDWMAKEMYMRNLSLDEIDRSCRIAADEKPGCFSARISFISLARPTLKGHNCSAIWL
jgi:hypothetical protein